MLIPSLCSCLFQVLLPLLPSEQVAPRRTRCEAVRAGVGPSWYVLFHSQFVVSMEINKRYRGRTRHPERSPGAHQPADRAQHLH